MSCGALHTCALLDDGSTKCWGNNFVGELGDTTTQSSKTPVAVAGLTGATLGFYRSATLRGPRVRTEAVKVATWCWQCRKKLSITRRYTTPWRIGEVFDYPESLVRV